MSAADIRALLPPQFGPIRRFKAGIKPQRSHHLEQFRQKQLIEESFSSHNLAPRWSSEEPCVNYAKLRRLSAEPRNIARRCPTQHDIPVATLNQWHQEFGAMIQSVSHR